MDEITGQELPPYHIRVGGPRRDVLDRFIDSLLVIGGYRDQTTENFSYIIPGEQYPSDVFTNYARCSNSSNPNRPTTYTFVDKYKRTKMIDVETTPSDSEGHLRVLAINEHVMSRGHNGVKRPLPRLDVIVEKPIPK